MKLTTRPNCSARGRGGPGKMRPGHRLAPPQIASTSKRFCPRQSRRHRASSPLPSGSRESPARTRRHTRRTSARWWTPRARLTATCSSV
eukprot:UN4926